MPALHQILSDYQQSHQIIPAFNIDSFEIYQAVELAVRETGLPAIVQLSPGEDRFLQAEKIFLLVKKARLENLPIFLNIDHGQDRSRLLQLARLGFDMLHFDGSSLDYSSNLNTTREFILQAKKCSPSLLVEAEFNRIHPVDNSLSGSSFTSPDQAVEFITSTGCDLLAVSIGNLHGVSVSVPETLDLNLLSQIYSQTSKTFLTLHGGSGISPDQISQSRQLGIVKININTDLRLEFRRSLISSLSASTSPKIYEIFSPVISDLKKLIIEKIIFLSSIH